MLPRVNPTSALERVCRREGGKRARPGRWIGAKVGLFAVRTTPGGEYGYADYDWFRVE